VAKVLRSSNMYKCIGCFTCELICAAMNKKSHSLHKSAIKIRTYGGVSGKFVESVCHACNDPACAVACRCDALTPRKGGGVTLDTHKCIGCRRCMKACSVNAVFFDEDAKLPIICSHCGVCARFCPHDCLYVEEVAE